MGERRAIHYLSHAHLTKSSTMHILQHVRILHLIHKIIGLEVNLLGAVSFYQRFSWVLSYVTANGKIGEWQSHPNCNRNWRGLSHLFLLVPKRPTLTLGNVRKILGSTFIFPSGQPQPGSDSGLSLPPPALILIRINNLTHKACMGVP